MTVGTVKGTTTAYQGSGLETAGANNGTKTGNSAHAGDTVKITASPNTGERKPDMKTTPIERSEAQQKESLKRAVEEINRKAKNSVAVFGVHDKTNRLTIKILDKDTREVIKEFPPEQTLDMIAKVWELAGLMVDEKR